MRFLPFATCSVHDQWLCQRIVTGVKTQDCLSDGYDVSYGYVPRLLSKGLLTQEYFSLQKLNFDGNVLDNARIFSFIQHRCASHIFDMPALHEWRTRPSLAHRVTNEAMNGHAVPNFIRPREPWLMAAYHNCAELHDGIVWRHKYRDWCQFAHDTNHVTTEYKMPSI